MKKIITQLSGAFAICTFVFSLLGFGADLFAQQDVLIMKHDPLSKQAQVVISNGTITEADYTGIRWTTGRGASERTIRYNPWDVEWIRFGDIIDAETTEEYNQGVQLLINQTWDRAAEIFAKMLRHEGHRRTWGPVWQIRRDARRSIILYTTYYYHGYALLQSGLSRQRVAQQQYQNILKIFPIGLSGYANRNRRMDFERNPEKTERVKKVVSDAITEVRRELKRQGASSPKTDEQIDKYLEEISEATKAEQLEVIVGKFMDICVGYFSSNFRAAVDTLNEPFKNPELDERALKFSQYRPFYFFNMKLAVAQAYFGLREFAEGAYEIDEFLTQKPGRSSENPSLQSVVNSLSQRNNKFLEYLVEGYFLTANAYESEPDYRSAQNVYNQILRVLRNDKNFQDYINDAMLSIAMCQAKMQRIDEANKTLEKLLEDFIIPEGTVIENWNNNNIIPRTKASLYMGVYLTMGEMYYDQYSRTDNPDPLLKAFTAYQKVTALFSADDEKKAQALFWLNKIALEIAEVKFSQFKGSPPTLRDNRLNPYKYYTDLASQYKTELQRHYQHTEWAQLIQN